MAKRKWSDLNANQKTRGVALIKTHEQFILKDDNGIPLPESDSDLIRRIADEWLHELALSLHKNEKANEAREAANDL